MENSYSGPERRRFKRVNVSLSVLYSTEGPLDVRIRTEKGEFVATMVDISEGGLSIIAETPLEVLSLIWIKLTLLKSNGNKVSYEFFGRVEVLGEVRHTTSLEKNVYRAGIAFMQINEECQRNIAHFIEFMRDGAVPGDKGSN